jgi:hypothetical protein
MTSEPAGDELTAPEREALRRRLAEVFGDVLPDQTSDDVNDPETQQTEGSEEWLKRQVPPHHG